MSPRHFPYPMQVRRPLCALILALAPPLAHAERPMAVDDAGTLDVGGFKLEAGWSRDDRARGWEAAAGFGPVENLELELGFGRARDRATTPDTTLRGVGFAAKWVPLQADEGLSAGLKFEYARERAEAGDEDEKAHVRALSGLASWRFGGGQIAHLNLGREWVRVEGDTEAANTWGLGFEQPLTDTLQLTLEAFGAEHSRPDRQVGLRYEIAEGVKLSAAVGRGSDRTIANAGVAWEF